MTLILYRTRRSSTPLDDKVHNLANLKQSKVATGSSSPTQCDDNGTVYATIMPSEQAGSHCDDEMPERCQQLVYACLDMDGLNSGGMKSNEDMERMADTENEYAVATPSNSKSKTKKR